MAARGIRPDSNRRASSGMGGVRDMAALYRAAGNADPSGWGMPGVWATAARPAGGRIRFSFHSFPAFHSFIRFFRFTVWDSFSGPTPETHGTKTNRGRLSLPAYFRS